MSSRILVAIAIICAAAGHAAAQSISWPTFGGSNQRTGYNPSETVLSTATVPAMRLHWSASIGQKANAPILVSQVPTRGGVYDLVFVTAHNGAVAALDSATGHPVWSVNVGQTQTTCGNKVATLGIGQPPTADTVNNRLLFVDGAGLLHGLDLGTGTEQPGFPFAVVDAPNQAAGTSVSHASPTLVGSTLYVTTATPAPCEDTGSPAHGQVMAVDLVAKQVTARFYPTGNGALRGGGIWGPGGVSAEMDGSFLYGATANALPTPQNAGAAEKIIKLDPGLNLVAVDGPALPRGGDYDFGATPLLFQPAACPPLLAAMNKTGLLVIYDRTQMQNGPIQTLTVAKGGANGLFIGIPAYDPVTSAIYLGSPADSPDGVYLHGLLALQADATCNFSLLWHQTAGLTGTGGAHAIPATVANGVVYYASDKPSIVSAFDAATGMPLWNSGTAIKAATRAAPMGANGQLFVAAGTQLFAFGL